MWDGQRGRLPLTYCVLVYFLFLHLFMIPPRPYCSFSLSPFDCPSSRPKNGSMHAHTRSGCPIQAQVAAALVYVSCLPHRWSRCQRWMASCWLGTLWHGMGRKRGSFRDPFRGRFCNPIMHPMGPRSDSCPREMLRFDVSSSRAGAIACLSSGAYLGSRCCAAVQALLWDGAHGLYSTASTCVHVPSSYLGT